jgi:hypothetical protein
MLIIMGKISTKIGLAKCKTVKDKRGLVKIYEWKIGLYARYAANILEKSSGKLHYIYWRYKKCRKIPSILFITGSSSRTKNLTKHCWIRTLCDITSKMGVGGCIRIKKKRNDTTGRTKVGKFLSIYKKVAPQKGFH